MKMLRLIKCLVIFGCLTYGSKGLSAQEAPFNPDNPPEPAFNYRLTLAVEPEEAGYISFYSGSPLNKAGTTVRVNTSANKDYSFLCWKVVNAKGESTVLESTDNPLTYTTAACSQTLCAVYQYDPQSPLEPEQINQYRLYLTSNIPDACSFNRASGTKVLASESVSLHAYYDAGFIFLGWFCNEDRISTSPSFTYQRPTGNTDTHITLEARILYSPDNPAEPLHTEIILPEVVLADNVDNTSLIEEYADKRVNVTIQRTFKGNGVWSTLCLPFSLSSLTGTPFEGADIMEYVSATGDAHNGISVNCSPVQSIEAGRPYLIRPVAEVANPRFEKVVLTQTEGQSVSDDNDQIRFVGVLTPKSLTTDNTDILFLVNNYLYYTNVNASLNAFRAYFQIVVEAWKGAPMRIAVDHTPTDIKMMAGRNILQGKYIRNGRMIIIHNEKKYNAHGTQIE